MGKRLFYEIKKPALLQAFKAVENTGVEPVTFPICGRDALAIWAKSTLNKKARIAANL